MKAEKQAEGNCGEKSEMVKIHKMKWKSSRIHQESI